MLGDTIESALSRIGITQDRVVRWLGKPCGCAERKEKLNALHAWAKRTRQETVDRALDYLNRILS